MFGSTGYNYEQFNRKSLLSDAVISKFGGAPKPGDKAPDFEGRTLEGDKVRLSDFRGEKNVVLTFGSATCPQSAGSIGGLNDLYEDYRDENTEFLYVYVREAHPGEDIPAHRSMNDKIAAAERFRDEEDIAMSIVVDDLGGKIHRKYGSLPNPTFIVDRSGRVAFRSLATRPKTIAAALDELLEVQEERGTDHAIVQGGEETWMPSMYTMVNAYRALERGGRGSLDTFKREMGMPGRMAVAGSRVAGPIADHPAAAISTVAAVGGVIALGLWVGRELRKRRFTNPYEYRGSYGSSRRGGDYSDYEAVGI